MRWRLHDGETDRLVVRRRERDAGRLVQRCRHVLVISERRRVHHRPHITLRRAGFVGGVASAHAEAVLAIAQAGVTLRAGAGSVDAVIERALEGCRATAAEGEDGVARGRRVGRLVRNRDIERAGDDRPGERRR